MRYCLFITLFTVGYVFNGFSQTEIESKRIVIHNAFVKFFRQHAAINEIRFNVDKNSDSVRFEILEHSNNEAIIRVVYDLNHKGDRYSFKKKYGRFIFPFSIYKDFIDPRASYINIEGRVRQDSVFMSINQWYEPKNQETEKDKIFEKVETNAKYEKGNLELPVLHQYHINKIVQKSLSCGSISVLNYIFFIKHNLLLKFFSQVMYKLYGIHFRM